MPWSWWEKKESYLLTPYPKTTIILTKTQSIMTAKTFNADEFIEQSTNIVHRIKDYTENNTPSPELVDSIKELYSELSNFQSKLDEIIVEDGETK